MIYADNSATTQVRQEVIEAMLPFLSEKWGNASSLHGMGRAAHDAVNNARAQVAKLLNCSPEEIRFTGCGTDSNNVAILGRARSIEANEKGRHLITTQIEHPSGYGPAQFLESKGWRVTYLPVDSEGFVHEDKLAKAITDNTTIISIIWANNEIGTVQNIGKLAALAAERGIFFHTDAVQAIGKVPIDLSRIPISSLASSGHKFHAPKGIGFLFLRKETNLMPIEFGGGQERGLFPGTEPVANIVAIGKAAELAGLELDQNIEHLQKLQKKLFDKIRSIPELKITGAHQIESRLPGHVSFTVPGVEGESLVVKFDLKGICISSGSACHTGVIEPSTVLKALQLSNHEAMGSLRISLGRFNTEKEVDQIITVCDRVLSPVLNA